jgi:hypothetical protein
MSSNYRKSREKAIITESPILRWIASPIKHDVAVSTSDVDGRVREVHFILGKAARDSFLERHRLILAAWRKAAAL